MWHLPLWLPLVCVKLWLTICSHAAACCLAKVSSHQPHGNWSLGVQCPKSSTATSKRVVITSGRSRCMWGCIVMPSMNILKAVHLWSDHRKSTANVAKIRLKLLYFLGILCLYFTDRTAEEWTGNGEREREWHAAKGHRWNQTSGRCGNDRASVYGAPALPTEPPRAPLNLILNKGLIKQR